MKRFGNLKIAKENYPNMQTLDETHSYVVFFWKFGSFYMVGDGNFERNTHTYSKWAQAKSKPDNSWWRSICAPAFNLYRLEWQIWPNPGFPNLLSIWRRPAAEGESHRNKYLGLHFWCTCGVSVTGEPAAGKISKSSLPGFNVKICTTSRSKGSLQCTSQSNNGVRKFGVRSTIFIIILMVDRSKGRKITLRHMAHSYQNVKPNEPIWTHPRPNHTILL